MMTSSNANDGYNFDPKIGVKNLLFFTSNKELDSLYLIRIDDQNIGYIILTFGFSFEYKGRDAFIDELFIKEGFRNQGIGSLAMDFSEAESRKLDVMAIHLEVEPHNLSANRLYFYKGYHSNNRILLTKRISNSNI